MPFDASDSMAFPSNSYPFILTARHNFSAGTPAEEGTAGRLLVNNQRKSPFGTGWTLDGLQRLVVNGTPTAAHSAVLTEGNGSIKLFSLQPPSLFDVDKRFGVGDNPYFIVTEDFNADNKLDLAVANYLSGPVSILRGNGDGTFTTSQTVPVGTGPVALALGKFRSGMDPPWDIAVANFVSNTVSILLGDGLGSFAVGASIPIENTPSALAIGDFNADSRLDLVVTRYAAAAVAVLLGNGDGSFGAAQDFAVGNNPSGVAVADFNGNGVLDLAVANYSSNSVGLLLGNGNGTGAEFRRAVRAGLVDRGGFRWEWQARRGGRLW